MKKRKKTKDDLERVLVYQDKTLSKLRAESNQRNQDTELEISRLEEELREKGIDIEKIKHQRTQKHNDILVVPSFDQICKEAERVVGKECEFESIFSPEELEENKDYIKQLNREFRQLNRLDAVDIAICALASIVSAAVNILMVGIPQKGKEGLTAGPLSDFIRNRFDACFPEEEMQRLAGMKESKVPYDAQDNRNTTERVVGLSAYYHRLLSLGHDPLLGFVVGVFDIITGRMTTIDKEGKIVSQIMENYSERKESDIFSALAKQVIHLKTDVTTSMGLPVPLMGVFNLLQIGDIGKEEQTVAEIVQGMYYEGYDFIHFCAMSMPVMITELVVRIAYAFKRIHEGYSIRESIPFSKDRGKCPKLNTMLFVAHSGATAVNAGYVYFKKSPLAINYPQWLAFARYSYGQLKWILREKPNARIAYVNKRIEDDWEKLEKTIDDSFVEFSKGYKVVFE